MSSQQLQERAGQVALGSLGLEAMKIALFALISALLISPVFAEESPHPKSDLVFVALSKAGIEVKDLKVQKHEEGSPLPNVYVENVSFSLESVAPKGGQIFICTKKKYVEAIAAHYEPHKALAPYLFRSKDGLVYAQLNSGLSVVEAEKFEEALGEFSLPN